MKGNETKAQNQENPVNFGILCKLATEGEMSLAEVILILEWNKIPMTAAVRSLGIAAGHLHE